MKFITKEPICVGNLKDQMTFPDCGAICTFEGTVRNHHRGRSVRKLGYQAYGPMAEKEMEKLKTEIQKEWPKSRVNIIHRIGELQIGDVAVAIVVWAPHRKEAFRACEAAIDRLKKRVPIWKKEFYDDGKAEWTQCRH